MSATVQSPTAERRSVHPALAAAGMTAALGAILVVLLALFILPSLKSGPHDLPLAVVGTTSDVETVVAHLEKAAPDAYEVDTDLTADQVEDAIRDREVNGALVIRDDSVQAYVGQALPPGATGALVRSAAYFDFAGAAVPLLTLVLWVVAGVALTAVALLRPTTEDEVTPAT